MKLRYPPTHVIFDLDGVLLDTERLYTEAIQSIVGRFGRRFTWDVKAKMMGRDPIVGARHVIEVLELPMTPEQFLAEREPILKRLMRSTDAIPGAEQFVDRLASRGTPLAVATSSERQLAELKIAPHPWFSRMSAFICGDDPAVKHRKPAPDLFLCAAASLGARPEECVVFEDSPAGVQAAIAAGMQVVAVPDPAMDRKPYALADLVIAGYRDLTAADLGL